MTQAIGSVTSGPANPGATAATLDGQLARYQKQLSECVNCDSSKTPEGQAQIQDLSAKIAEVKARIDKVTEPEKISATRPAISTTGSVIDTSA
jgi:hypothetical protein